MPRRTTKTHALAALLLLLTGGSAMSANYSFPADAGYLPATEQNLYPFNIAGVCKGTLQKWQPTLADVARLEAALPGFLADRAAEGKKTPPAKAYARQYLGALCDGAPLIYASFLPVDSGWSAADMQARLIVTQDGGAQNWHVYYNVNQRTFSEPAFNGDA